jgi:ABC-type bacteriocin/lantibiotic exporter with double-glycine peptidase domain
VSASGRLKRLAQCQTIAEREVNGKSLKARRLMIPEVVQTSAMDCGPASLKSLFEGFGVSLSYGRLREACQTDVDGTSIDTIEDVAVQLGLEAEQTMIPLDHLLLPEARALPAIVVTTLPNGSTHFVVVWRRHGRFVQVMDPATGRRWPIEERFIQEVYNHALPVPAAAWRAWAGSEEFTGPLRKRMSDVGIGSSTMERLLDVALSDSGWHSIASLDAATRMIQSIIRSKGLRRGHHAALVLEKFFDRALNEQADQRSIIPSGYWSVRVGGSSEDGTEYLNLRGAVIVRVRNSRQKNAQQILAEGAAEAQSNPISPELVAALEEPPTRPAREIFRLLRKDGLFTPAGLAGALALVSCGLVFEALLFRGLLDIGREFNLVSQRLQALSVLLVFILGMLLLELPITDGLQKLGRHLEARLRMAILEKLPRLGDRYFHSRLTSDMTERSHTLYAMRMLPGLGGQMLRSVFGLTLTTAAIAWLDPPSAPLAILIAIASVIFPLLTQPFIIERDLRVRTHAGALTRFYLDALLGLVPIRAHGAARAIRHEHESLLVEWVRSSLGLQRRVVAIEAVQSLISFALASWILFSYLGRAGEAASALLIIYWSLNLPVLGQVVAMTAQQYPVYRNITLRLLEPLSAPEETDDNEPKKFDSSDQLNSNDKGVGAVAISFRDVTLKAGGHIILESINLEIQAGSQVAIVGPSGAGKSSLVGLLLGWHRPAQGSVLIDDAPLDGERLQELRRETVWVDPTVEIWNRSLLDNLRYGVHTPTGLPLSKVLELSQLSETLRKLPEGLQTYLGESGALVSGGEGQRVRLGRGMLRPGARLVILDEPFRGLDRKRRRELLSNSRLLWRDATMLCITHDVSEVQNFERVIVLDQGLIVEDGSPVDLLKRPDSRYRALIEAEAAVRENLWRSSIWRRLKLENGRLFDNKN